MERTPFDDRDRRHAGAHGRGEQFVEDLQHHRLAGRLRAGAASADRRRSQGARRHHLLCADAAAGRSDRRLRRWAENFAHSGPHIGAPGVRSVLSGLRQLIVPGMSQAELES